MTLRAGFAEVDYTPAPGLSLQGQMHERIATHARDPLLATACALEQGEDAEGPLPVAVLVSADICFLPDPLVRETRAEFARRTGLPAERLLLHATHTHVAPAPMALLAATPDAAFVARLQEALLEAAEGALARREAVTLWAGTGRLEQMGWNRRAMFADGTSRMYGHAGQPGFIGLEGPRDPALPVIAARGADGRVRGLLTGFATHPNAIEGACVYSADIPGAAREVVKAALGPEVAVLYFTGAAGNTAPSILDPHVPEQPWRGEEGLRRSGLYLGAELLKTLAACTSPMPGPALRMEQAELAVPLRPWPERGAPTFPEPLVNDAWTAARPYYQRAAETWPRRLAEESPVPVRLSVLRIGDAAICTNPAELFVEFGLAIRARSPARVTLIAELTDGYAGYIPTRRAFARGGYETWAAPSSQLVPEAGEEIVRATADLLRAAFAA